MTLEAVTSEAVTSEAVTPPVRFGFVGAGWIATEALAPAVHAADGAVLQAVAARDEQRARALEPAGRVFAGDTAYAELLADPDVDVVYISLSNEAHVPWVIAAVAAGKHVLCEKPLALTAAQATAAFDAADAAGRLLVEAFFYRWHPRTRRVEDLVRSGELGQVHTVDAAFCFDDADWAGASVGNYRLDSRRGGGALYDVGVYPLSVARWALPGFGDADPILEQVEVTWSGSLSPVGSGPVDLRTDATIRVSPDVTARIRSAIAGGSEESARIVSEDAVVTLAGKAFTTRHSACDLIFDDPRGEAGRSVETFAAVDPYRLMVEAVAARIRGEDTFCVTREDSLAIARVSDAVRAAAAPEGEHR